MQSLDASGLRIGTVRVIAAARILVEFGGLGRGGLRWMQRAARWRFRSPDFVFGGPSSCSL
jgi:hypothetical protein